MKRAQAALEYISTYGWAFMAVLITIGALTYFGAFDIGSLRGSECAFSPGLICEDFVMRPDNGGEAVVRLRNNYGVDIDISGVTATSDRLIGLSCTSYPVLFASESVDDFICTWNDPLEYVKGQNYEFSITIIFTQDGGTYSHTAMGTLSTTAQ